MNFIYIITGLLVLMPNSSWSSSENIDLSYEYDRRMTCAYAKSCLGVIVGDKQQIEHLINTNAPEAKALNARLIELEKKSNEIKDILTQREELVRTEFNKAQDERFKNNFVNYMKDKFREKGLSDDVIDKKMSELAANSKHATPLEDQAIDFYMDKIDQHKVKLDEKMHNELKNANGRLAVSSDVPEQVTKATQPKRELLLDEKSRMISEEKLNELLDSPFKSGDTSRNEGYGESQWRKRHMRGSGTPGFIAGTAFVGAVSLPLANMMISNRDKEICKKKYDLSQNDIEILTEKGAYEGSVANSGCENIVLKPEAIKELAKQDKLSPGLRRLLQDRLDKLKEQQNVDLNFNTSSQLCSDAKVKSHNEDLVTFKKGKSSNVMFTGLSKGVASRFEFDVYEINGADPMIDYARIRCLNSNDEEDRACSQRLQTKLNPNLGSSASAADVVNSISKDKFRLNKYCNSNDVESKIICDLAKKKNALEISSTEYNLICNKNFNKIKENLEQNALK